MASTALTKRTGTSGALDFLKDRFKTGLHGAVAHATEDIVGPFGNSPEKEFLENQKKLLSGRIDATDKTVKGFLQRLAILFIRKEDPKKRSSVNISATSPIYHLFKSYPKQVKPGNITLILFGTKTPLKVYCGVFLVNKKIIKYELPGFKLEDEDSASMIQGKNIVNLIPIEEIDIPSFREDFLISLDDKYSGSNAGASSVKSSAATSISLQKKWELEKNVFKTKDVHKIGTEDSDPLRFLEMVSKSVLTGYSKGFKRNDPINGPLVEWIIKNQASAVFDKAEVMVLKRQNKITGCLIRNGVETVISANINAQVRSVKKDFLYISDKSHAIVYRKPFVEFKKEYYIKYSK